MKTRLCLGASLLSLIIACAMAAEPAPPSVVPATAPSIAQLPPARPALTDDRVGISIQRAANFLLTNFDAHGTLKTIDGITNQVDHDGLEALCVYALLEAGQATSDPHLILRDPQMRLLIEQLKRCPLRSDPNVVMPVTFARSFRAAALSIYNRPEDRGILKDDVDWLLRAHRGGAYTYDDNWPNDQPIIQVQPPAAGPALILNRPIAVTGGIAVSKNGTYKPGAFKIDNTYVNKQANNTYINHQQDNFYPGRQRETFYFGRDLCIPSKGRVIVGATTPQTATTRPTAPATPIAPATPSQISVAIGVNQPLDSTTPSRVTITPAEPAPWDNSNSQLGAFGVYSAAQVGIEVPKSYWQAVDGHWIRCQQDDGQWGYSESDPDPRVSMTCAGLASFYVTYDRLGATIDPKKLGNPALTPRMAKAMDWLDQSDNSINMLGPLTRYVSYNLFTLERVGLDGGYKYFGSHDWYRELAGRVISVQWPNGAFGRNFEGYDTVLESAFTLVFLSRGRPPVMMEKLQFDGDWSNRPRDLANTTRFASRALERPLNWEVVPLNRDWTDWLDSTLMYIASDQAPNFSDADIAKLHNYINAGGTIFTHADGGSAAFNDYIAKTLSPKLFPHAQMIPIPADDSIYTMQYQLTAKTAPMTAPPPLMGIRDGLRWLLVHSSADLAGPWQTRAEKASPQNFELATNLFVYASQKQFRNRIAPMVAATTQPSSAH